VTASSIRIPVLSYWFYLVRSHCDCINLIFQRSLLDGSCATRALLCRFQSANIDAHFSSTTTYYYFVRSATKLIYCTVAGVHAPIVNHWYLGTYDMTGLLIVFPDYCEHYALCFGLTHTRTNNCPIQDSVLEQP
jgi:hypothetical protein